MKMFHCTVIYLLLLYTCTPVYAFPEGADTLYLGTRTFITTQKTPNGTPVIHLWEAQRASENQLDSVKFPQLKGAQHFDVWKPVNRQEGVYNHFAALFFYNGLFYAMWGNHLYGENGPGQRVLFSTSKNGHEWAAPKELFPPPDSILPRGEVGVYLGPDRWVEVDGKLYAVVYVHKTNSSHSYPIVRELAKDGTFLGEPSLLSGLPKKAMLPKFMSAPLRDPLLADKIDKWYIDNDAVSWWAYLEEKGIPASGVDGTRLIEAFSFRSKEGVVVYMRDYNSQTKISGRISSNRIFACFSDGQGGWSAMYPTDIPDSHSRAQAVRLSDGSVLLVGNQIAPEFDKGLYLVRNPLTISFSPDGEFFTKVFALRSGDPDRVKHRFTGIPGNGPAGFGYPSMIIHNDMIYVLYSINKEDIAITIVPLASIF